MDFFYEKMEHNELFWALKNNQTICKSLAYMATFKEYETLQVKQKKHSIEIFNNDLILSILLFVGFENEEYLENYEKDNFNIVSFDKYSREMLEFSNFKNSIKYINSKAWFYTSLSLSGDTHYDSLKTILEI